MMKVQLYVILVDHVLLLEQYHHGVNMIWKKSIPMISLVQQWTIQSDIFFIEFISK